MINKSFSVDETQTTTWTNSTNLDVEENDLKETKLVKSVSHSFIALGAYGSLLERQFMSRRIAKYQEVIHESIQKENKIGNNTSKYIKAISSLRREKIKNNLSELDDLEIDVLMIDLIDWYLISRLKGTDSKYSIKRYDADLYCLRMSHYISGRCQRHPRKIFSITDLSIAKVRSALAQNGWFLSLNEQMCSVSNSKYIYFLISKYKMYLYHTLIKERIFTLEL